ncbi:hypothetical protein [Burkholderia ubonensis]|uniref:hypothetical protein n=1 Tax=Burkholderia ubonensis TaxID=101571 RepID=UPI000A7B7611|nr:hypothetical protein [Burkholderia ubonensis]
MSRRPHVWRVSPLASIDSLSAAGELVAFNVGPDDAVYMVFALEPLDYRIQSTGASFAKTQPSALQRYRVFAWKDGQALLDLVIDNEPFNIHEVQPVGDDLLLVCVRSVYRGPDDFDLNGRLYRRDGVPCGEILLGDGIQTVQVTGAGEIWTSYFDEGVFGNYGWSAPVGAAGLIAWNRQGDQTYAFSPPDGLGPIYDCYALNVQNDRDVWLYYYDEFALVHLRDRQTVASWGMPAGGCHAFAVMADPMQQGGYVALLGGSYKDRNALHLVRLGRDGNARLIRAYHLQGEGPAPVEIARMVGRGRALHVVGTDRNVYRIDIADIATVGHDAQGDAADA